MRYFLICHVSLLALLLMVCVSFNDTSAQTITTYAGGIGNDTTASIYGRVNNAGYIVHDGTNNIYFLDKILGNPGKVRRLNTATNRLSFVEYGSAGVFDAVGNWYYISGNPGSHGDVLGNKVMKRTPAGVVTTIAGNGSSTFSGDGGSATLAGLTVNDVAIDNAGNLYICDYNNWRIRKVDAAGIITTVAGNGIPGYDGDGSPATLAKLNGLSSIAVDGSGNIFITDNSNKRIRKVNSSGIISTIAGGGTTFFEGMPATSAKLDAPRRIRVDGAGNVIVSCDASRIRKISTSGFITTIAGAGFPGFSGDTGPATAAQLGYYSDIALDLAGNIYISDFNNRRIRIVNSAGTINTISGGGISLNGYADNSSPLLAVFNNPAAIATDAAGNIFVADAGNHRIRKVSISGTVTTYAGNGTAAYYGDGGPATLAAINDPVSLAFDGLGNLYIGESDGRRIRKVAPTGIITTLAGGGISGLGDGGPANMAEVRPTALAVDRNNNVFYTHGDVGARVRKIDALSGIITTVVGNGWSGTDGDNGPATAARISDAKTILFDRKGNMYLGANPIRKVDTAGIITSLPIGGYPKAIDTMGNLYLATNNTISRYDIYNYLSVIAGTGTAGYTGDKGPATAAQLSASGICVDTFGNLYFSGYHSIRRVCCLPSVIDMPPLFVKGSSASITVCTNGTAFSIDTSLKVTDGDIGDILTWTISRPPEHGSLGGFPNATVSTGGIVTPSGLTYTPDPGYAGSDNFYIRVSDGVDTGQIRINISVNNEGYSVNLNISGSDKVCVGSSTNLSSNSWGGSWSVSNGNATINSSGSITGISAGTVVVSYTMVFPCIVSTATKTITVNDIGPKPTIEPGAPSVCVDASITFNAAPAGGKWNVSASFLAGVDINSGLVTGKAEGRVIVSYSYATTCGQATDTTSIQVLPKPKPKAIYSAGSHCAGDTLTLYNSDPGGVWASSDTSLATITGSGHVTFIAQGDVTISYSVTNNCGTANTTKVVTIHPSNVLPPISGKSVLITGKTTELRGRAPSGIWSTSDSAVATIDQWGVVSGIAPGEATITYKEAGSNGCNSIATLLVKVNTNNTAEFSFAPNPASHSLSLRYEKSSVHDADISFTDIAGRTVYTGKLDMPSASGTIKFNITGIPSGVYTISIKSGGGEYTGRLVIVQ